MRTTVILFSVAMALSPAIGMSKGARNQAASYTALETDEILTAQFMREEEKLARDVYRVMFQVWGKRIFSNIALSEQTHMDKMGDLLARLNIEDPVPSDAVGDFWDEGLSEWFVELTDHGNSSFEEALRVGALIEETDIRDIQQAIDETDEMVIETVYLSLLQGSRNHLRAYVGQLEKLGVVYEPVLLTLEELSAIVDTPTERGGR